MRLYKILRFLIRRKLYYAIRNSWPVWFFILNHKGVAGMKKNPPNLNLVQKRILNDWNKDGIAVTNIEELFPGLNLLALLTQYAKSISDKAEVKDKKLFLKFLFDLHPILDLKNPYARLALEKKVLDIVNGYMGMWSTLRAMTLNITTPIGQGLPPEDSQKWHRDPEDKVVCKMFLYLSDVDENSGPFIYALSTHHKGSWKNLFPTDPPAGSYPPAEEVERTIPEDKVKVFNGLAGTIIFCETTGLHKGGYAKSKERLMFTAMYSSKKSMHPKALRIPIDGLPDGKNLTPEQVYAIN